MNNMVVILLAYWLISVSATYAVRYFNSKKHAYKKLFAEKESLRKKVVTFLSIWLIVPLAMPCILIYLLYQFITKLKYRNRPRPVSKKLKRYVRKDTVLDEANQTMSLAEYNHKHGTHFTLDQVYGKGYEEALSDEEKSQIRHYEPRTLELKFEEKLLDTAHTVAATALGNALVSGDFKDFESMLLDDVETTLYCSKNFVGKKDVVDYWKDWRERYVLTKDVTDFEVKHSHYYSNSCLHMKSMVVLFMMEGNNISRMILATRHISGGVYSYHDDLVEDYPFNMEYIGRYLKPLREANEIFPPVVKEHRLPCFCCGTKSEELNWYTTNLEIGYHGYFDQVSICPKCNKVVEYFTEGRYRIKSPVIEEYIMLKEYVNCWNNLTVGELEDYLSDDFHYSSTGVLEELDKNGYIEYFSAKLQRIAETRSDVKARVAGNLLVVNQDGTNYVIAVKFNEGKIIRADMSPASFYGFPDKEDLSGEKFNLLGLVSFSNACPLKGTKYLDSISPDIIVKRLDYSKLGEEDPYIKKTLREVVEDCEWLFMSEMVSKDKESLELFKNCYKEAVNDGVFEAANNLGILAFNYEDDVIEANRWLNLSAYKGSRNAMINQFSIHWTNEEYLKGVVLLQNMLNKQNPSLKCLWNLACLYYKGYSWTDVFVEQDVEKAKRILSVIANYDRDKICDEEKMLPEKAGKVLVKIENSNVYADCAKEFHDMLLSRIVRDDKKKDKSEVFACLSSLNLTNGKHLGLRLANENTSETGDYSNFYIYGEDGSIDENVLKSLHIHPTAISAWQIYLLMTSPTVMPVFWHGGYITRKFIYSESDLDGINQLQEYDFSAAKRNNILLPSVTIEKEESSNKYIAHVHCCYWNDWKGLVREYAKIVINQNSVESFENSDDLVLYKYDCGFFF